MPTNVLRSPTGEVFEWLSMVGRTRFCEAITSVPGEAARPDKGGLDCVRS
jgi:hypothetical protein